MTDGPAAVGLGRRRVLAGAGALLAAVGAGTAPAACAGDPAPWVPAWEPWEPEPGARVRRFAAGAAGLLAAGSARRADGATVPGLWRRATGGAWQTLGCDPVTFYGERSELTILAAGPAGVVAAGGSVGGVHGNPRRATWWWDGTVLREQTAAFETYGGPSMIGIRAAASGASSVVFVGTRVDEATNRVGAAVWVSPDGRSPALLVGVPGLAAEDGEQVHGLWVAAAPDGFVAVGDGFATDGTDATTSPRAWRSGDGRAWERVTVGTTAPRGAAVSVQVCTADTAAGVVHRGGRSLLGVWRRDGADWLGATVDAPGVDRSVAVPAATDLTASGSRRLLGARLGGRPVVARSDDEGRSWRAAALPAAAPTGPTVDVAVGVADDRVFVSVSDATESRAWSARW